MAKPKLSKKARTNLRSTMKQMVSDDMPVAEIVSTLSKKYRVAGETIRWYLKKDGYGSARNGSTTVGNGTIGVGVKAATVTVRCGKKHIPIATVHYANEPQMVRMLKEAMHRCANTK